jgi:cytochrome c oxidase subunit 2
VPLDQPVQLIMSSQDVMHAFFVPEFRVKRDVIPGRYTKLWFTAVETGTFDVFCAEYCGTKHSQMLSKVHVHEPAKFRAWLEEASDFLARMPPAEAGALLYTMRGCKQCHSIDGSVGTGPSFAGLWGSSHALAGGGTVTVDENHIRQSILQPQALVTAGFEPVMPSYQGRLKDPEIGAIIEYVKTLQPRGAGAGR